MVVLARSPEQIGNAIRRARKKAGMSQSELGEKTGLRQGTISQIEQGHAAAKLETILSILSSLNLELHIEERSNFNFLTGSSLKRALMAGIGADNDKK